MRRILAAILLMSSLHAQTETPRPHVLGLAHVAFRASELNRTGSFYKRTLGFTEPFSLAEENGQAAMGIVKVDGHCESK